MSKNLEKYGELALQQVDSLGFQLDQLGIENNINRHNLMAAVFAGQKRLEGELDSVKARVGSTKANVESTIDAAEQLAKSGLKLIAFPATYTVERFKQFA
jgi:hypothetical protein